MSDLRVFVEVSDKYNWALRPFAYLFNLYWSSLQPVIVFGYSFPDFRLPPNFVFIQIDKKNYPPERWSDGFIKFLKGQNDTHFVLMLNDYWLIRTVDTRGVAGLYDYVKNRNNILRCDLTDDRLYAGGMYDCDMWGSYDIIETPFGTPYQMSTQAGIWNKNLIESLLQPGMSAWDVEINTQPPANMRVIGTRQRPVRYANGLNKGKLDMNQVNKIPEPHRSEVMKMIPEEYKWQSTA